jgi:predicted RND superfamily exporter protein
VLVALGAFLLLGALFRDLRAALAGWFASALPVAIILGLMGWLGVPVTLATVLIAGIALGLAVDDTVHLVFAVRRGVRAGAAPAEAVRKALVRVGERMIVTSLILAGSFAVMGLSDFVPTANFGLFTALTILLALAADLTLLPWMLGGRLGGGVREAARAPRRPFTNAHTAVHPGLRSGGAAGRAGPSLES